MRFLSRNILALVAILLGLLVLETIHTVVTPFLLAAVVAYLLNPLVKAVMQWLKLSRIVSVLLVYLTVIGILFFFVTQIGFLLAGEYKELNKEIIKLTSQGFDTASDLPAWGRDLVVGILETINPQTVFSAGRILPYFSGAFSRLESVFIFLIATFYFLKDGQHLIASFTNTLFGKRKEHMHTFYERAYEVLNNYLRGQVFLVLLMTIVSWLTLLVLNVKYALILGIFTGVAETVPIIGPIAAGAAAVTVALFDGRQTLGLPPIAEGALIASIYLVYRQLEDIFVIPYVLGRATKLHPLVILFAVLIGGHTWGVFGMILAVPTAALLRVVFEYLDEL